ncbi:MAG: hypothetical protein WB952_05745 [Terriglobales bacterium]
MRPLDTSALRAYTYGPVNDQHITAIATIAQDVLLFLSASLIGWYLWETRKMRKAAEGQVIKSQDLVEAAQRQVDASLEQVEAGSRPAVVAKAGPGSLAAPFLVNIGNGPAIELKWSVSNSNHAGTIPYLEAGQEYHGLFDVKVLYNAALQTPANTTGIECR